MIWWYIWIISNVLNVAILCGTTVLFTVKTLTAMDVHRRPVKSEAARILRVRNLWVSGIMLVASMVFCLMGLALLWIASFLEDKQVDWWIGVFTAFFALGQSLVFAGIFVDLRITDRADRAAETLALAKKKGVQHDPTAAI